MVRIWKTVILAGSILEQINGVTAQSLTDTINFKDLKLPVGQPTALTSYAGYL
ncbi:hypothetical protein ABW20_dc0100070 [Dactylellina cionopaga]|nr:hypothetical protein ABW20_dc0100070 [Dactylellina cionopaga]